MIVNPGRVVLYGVLIAVFVALLFGLAYCTRPAKKVVPEPVKIEKVEPPKVEQKAAVPAPKPAPHKKRAAKQKKKLPAAALRPSTVYSCESVKGLAAQYNVDDGDVVASYARKRGASEAEAKRIRACFS